MLDILIQFFTDYGYFAVFGMLLLCGFGLPVPEDITLVSGGVISGLGYTNPHIMCMVGLAGVLIGDSIMFLAGRTFGYRIQRVKMFRKILSPRRFSQIQRKFKQYGLGLLFVARFLPGLRSPIYLVSGMSRRVPFLTFLLMDGIAALISVPVWIYLGYFFADNLDLLMVYVSDVQKAIYLALGLLIVVILVIYLKKRFHSKLNAIAGDDHHAASTKAQDDQEISAATVISASASTSGTVPSMLSTALDSKEKETISTASTPSTESANQPPQAEKTSTNQDISARTKNAADEVATADKSKEDSDPTTEGAKTTASEDSLGSKEKNMPTSDVTAQDKASAAAPDSNASEGNDASKPEADKDSQTAESLENDLKATASGTVTIEHNNESHEESLGKKIKNKTLISKLSKASSLAATGKGHSQFNPGVGNKN